MAIDIWQNRNHYNELCKWWSRNEDDKYTDEELIMKRIPSGEFFAKEIAPEQFKDNIIAGTFLFDSSHVTIKSPDNLMGIKSEDLVLYQGEKWIVVNVQKTKAARIQNTFFASDSNCSHYWYLELRK